MGRIAEGAEVGVMGGFDPHRAPAADQAMKLLHSADDSVHVLKNMNRGKAVEGAVGERVRKTIEIHQNVGAAGGIPVDSKGAGLLVNPAADVENSAGLLGKADVFYSCSIASRRHS